MKLLLSLTVLSFTLALCQGFCMFSRPKAEIIDGQLIRPTVCTDPNNGSKHPFGSKWNTAKCMECSCSESGMECCARYGGIVRVEGCTAVVNPETCKYEFFEKDNPSKPCSQVPPSFLS